MKHLSNLCIFIYVFTCNFSWYIYMRHHDSYVCIYMHFHIYIYIYIHFHIYIYLYAFPFIYLHAFSYIHIYMHFHLNLHAFSYTHIYMHLHLHICTHVSAQTCLLHMCQHKRVQRHAHEKAQIRNYIEYTHLDAHRKYVYIQCSIEYWLYWIYTFRCT